MIVDPRELLTAEALRQLRQVELSAGAEGGDELRLVAFLTCSGRGSSCVPGLKVATS
jgi:hypothetical protein